MTFKAAMIGEEEDRMRKRRIEQGINQSSLTEKLIVVVISYLVADYINSFLLAVFHIDSFLLTNFVGIVSITGLLMIYFFIKGYGLTDKKK